MRLALYRHLQRLSPRYARTRLGDIVARIISDIGGSSASRRGRPRLGRQHPVPGRLRRHAGVARLAARPRHRRHPAGEPGRARLLPAPARSAGRPPATGQRRHRQLSHRDAAGPHARGRRQRPGPRDQPLPPAQRSLHRDADGYSAWLQRAACGLILSIGASIVLLCGGVRVVEARSLGTFAAFVAYQMRVLAPVQALMGLYRAGHRAGVIAPRARSARRRWTSSSAPTRGRCRRCAATWPSIASPWRPSGHRRPRGRQLRVAPGASVASSGRAAAAVDHCRAGLCGWRPDRGVVRLGGSTCATCGSPTCAGVVLVEQEPTLLHATIAGTSATAWPMRTGASDRQRRSPRHYAERRAAGVAAFIDSLPDRWNTIVGERGLQLSAVSASGWRLRAPSSPIRRCSCSTSRPRSSDRRRAVIEARAVMRDRTTLIISHRRGSARRRPGDRARRRQVADRPARRAAGAAAPSRASSRRPRAGAPRR